MNDRVWLLSVHINFGTCAKTGPPTSCCRLRLQSLHPINSYASQLADRPSAACPPPVVSQRYHDVIHTLFILGADDIHTVRGVWRVGLRVITPRHE